MAWSHYERLSALDATFLELEDESCLMHVGAVAVFDTGALSLPEGGFDIERFRSFVESQLVPRYRQRIARIPITNHPVWVDDTRFNLHYHVRHMSLPHPGDERLLKRLAGHVMSLRLDRNKPLWELWVVEGLAENRFALITKAHHCMMDGVGSANILTASMQTTTDTTVKEPPPWVPRPVPSPRDLLRGEVRRRVGARFADLRAARDAAAHPRRTFRALRNAVDGVREALGAGMHQASPTPLNVEIGSHRRFDWLRYDLDEVKEVKNRVGGTVNDVVLANVAGGLRGFLAGRGETVSDLDFRALVPVNIRTQAESGAMGNRVATLATSLPLGEADPRRRLDQVIETTRELKASKQAQGIETIEQLSDWGLAGFFMQFARLSALTRPFNVVVTNVPGPQLQAYLLGAPLREAYPLVPLYKNQALGIALFSYNGSLFWGLNADWDALPDLHDLVDALAEDFEALRKSARA